MHPFHDQCIRNTTDTQNCATEFVLGNYFMRNNILQDVYVLLKVLTVGLSGGEIAVEY